MIRTAAIAIFLTLYSILLGPPLIVYTILTRSPNALYWAGVKGLLFITHAVGMRVQVKGQENIPPGACLFAANHTSNADAPAIVGSIPRRIAIFAKKSLFDIPIVGLAFRLAHFIPVDRTNRDAALASVRLAAQFLKEGTSYLAYPEGTRSPDGRLQPFKKGSFVMAIEAGVPIVPVACAGAHRLMKKNSLVIHPGRVTVEFGKPIYVEGYTIDRRGELAQHVHAAIAALLPDDQKPAGYKPDRDASRDFIASRP